VGGSMSVDLSLIAGSFQFRDAFFQRRVVEVGDAARDSAVKPP
jgi:hypothetical protein